MNGITLECKYCGESLPAFAVTTQILLPGAGVDYCRECGWKDACDAFGLPWTPGEPNPYAEAMEQ